MHHFLTAKHKIHPNKTISFESESEREKNLKCCRWRVFLVCVRVFTFTLYTHTHEAQVSQIYFKQSKIMLNSAIKWLALCLESSIYCCIFLLILAIAMHMEHLENVLQYAQGISVHTDSLEPPHLPNLVSVTFFLRSEALRFVNCLLYLRERNACDVWMWMWLWSVFPNKGGVF